MARPSEQQQEALAGLLGLGSHSARKSHYPELLARLEELEAERNRYKWLFEHAVHGIFQASLGQGCAPPIRRWRRCSATTIRNRCSGRWRTWPGNCSSAARPRCDGSARCCASAAACSATRRASGAGTAVTSRY